MAGIPARDAFAAACERQAASCAGLGSPFTERLCRALPEVLDSGTTTGRYIHSFAGDIGPSGHSLPLRLCGALHHLVLTRTDARLEAVWPPSGNRRAVDDATFIKEVRDGLHRNDGAVCRFVESPPQTNEVRRSVMLLPALYVIAARFRGLPLRLHEVGASAGLNLLSDRFRLQAGTTVLGDPGSNVILRPEWRGDNFEAGDAPKIVSRRGCDLGPVDVSREAARLRLLSYLWPDQPERMELTRAAIGIAAGENLPVPDKADAADWLDEVLAERGGGTVTVVQHTIAWQYFPEAVKARGEALFASAGGLATERSPLARIAMEADDSGKPGARISLTLWPDGRTHELGRADFHGRWVDWRNPDFSE